jgi:hypothetical protein
MIAGCEACSENAEIPFDNILDRLTGSDPTVTDYVLEVTARCLQCGCLNYRKDSGGMVASGLTSTQSSNCIRCREWYVRSFDAGFKHSLRRQPDHAPRNLELLCLIRIAKQRLVMVRLTTTNTWRDDSFHFLNLKVQNDLRIGIPNQRFVVVRKPTSYRSKLRFQFFNFHFERFGDPRRLLGVCFGLVHMPSFESFLPSPGQAESDAKNANGSERFLYAARHCDLDFVEKPVKISRLV